MKGSVSMIDKHSLPRPWHMRTARAGAPPSVWVYWTGGTNLNSQKGYGAGRGWYGFYRYTLI